MINLNLMTPLRQVYTGSFIPSRRLPAISDHLVVNLESISIITYCVKAVCAAFEVNGSRKSCAEVVRRNPKSWSIITPIPIYESSAFTLLSHSVLPLALVSPVFDPPLIRIGIGTNVWECPWAPPPQLHDRMSCIVLVLEPKIVIALRNVVPLVVLRCNPPIHF